MTTTRSSSFTKTPCGQMRERSARSRDAIATLGTRGTYEKNRPKQANVIVDGGKFATAHAVRGQDAPDPLQIRENGVPLPVRLGDGLSTGLFLDQRRNRKWVLDVCRARPGLRVLNLFAYTCGFSVVAAVAMRFPRPVSMPRCWHWSAVAWP